MIHWDWVWTILVGSLLYSPFSGFYAWVNRERIIAEGDMEKAKTERMKMEKENRVYEEQRRARL